MPGDSSDEWARISSISQNREVWSYDDNWGKVGELEHSATLWKNESANLSSQEEWAVGQRGWMLPGVDNNWDDGLDYYNKYTSIVQNWSGSDLTPVDHIDHEPVRDDTDEFDVTLTVSDDFGAEVTIDHQVPYVSRDVQYDYNSTMETVYTYPTGFLEDEARDDDCSQEQLSIWQTDEASDGDTVVPLEYYGEFESANGWDVEGGILLSALEYK